MSARGTMQTLGWLTMAGEATTAPKCHIVGGSLSRASASGSSEVSGAIRLLRLMLTSDFVSICSDKVITQMISIPICKNFTESTLRSLMLEWRHFDP